ncbi:MAG: PAS domain S-box protein [Chromatiales bacterium]|nr:PAS domain S-box protein [Chromatiales bacterium]
MDHLSKPEWPIQRLTPLRITVLYAVVASLWMFFSDHLIDFLVDDPGTALQLYALKGWFFILITTLVLYFIIRYNNQILLEAGEVFRRNQELFRDVTESASDWVWEMDDQLRFSYVSERFYELTNMPQSRLIGFKRWEVAGVDTEQDPKWRSHRETLETHLPFRDFSYQSQIPDVSGRRHYFKISGKPVYDKGGRFKGYRGMGTDITRQVMAEEALKESRGTLDRLMSNLPGMAYRCRNDANWTMEFVSEGCKTLTGYSSEGLIGNRDCSYAELIHPEDQAIVWNQVQEALEKHTTFQLSYRIVTAQGSEKWVWEQGQGVFSDKGLLVALEGLMLDATERQQTQNALLALAQNASTMMDDEFYRSCVRDLAHMYDVHYASLGIFADETRQTIHTLALWQNDGWVENVAYPLAGTPCEEIVQGDPQLIPDGVMQRFPDDSFLQREGIQSYFGAPLISSTGEILGLVSVMGINPMAPNRWARPVLGIFANRIALELERRWAEERLHKSEAHNRLIVDTALDAVITINNEGIVSGWNTQAERIFGYPREEALDRKLSEIIIPHQYRAAHEEGLKHFRQSGEGPLLNRRIEITALHQDGHEFPVELSIVPLEHGTEVSFSAFVRDITRRRHAEDEMARLRKYLKNIIDSMPSVLVGVDPEGTVTEWNKQAEELTGVNRDQAHGRPFAEVLPHLEAQMKQVKEAISQRQPLHSERLVAEQNGEVHYSDVVVYPLFTNGTAGAVIRVDDVTNRVRIEQMMVQTEKMMSVGGLAAGMAHEINNPLSAILQACQNIQRRISPDLTKNQELAEQLGIDLTTVGQYFDERGIHHFLDGISDAGARAAKIVSDMLAFSRRSESHFTPSNLDELMETAVRLAASDYDLKKKYDFKRIRIERDYAPDMGQVSCDGTEIEQVVLNLLKNAAHAMSSANIAEPCITLRTRSEGDYACIEVIDNGPGMTKEVSRRVFEPFFTTKDVGVGTGLGLSVSYFIVIEQHAGRMSVDTAPGKGARFKICLPFQHRSGT